MPPPFDGLRRFVGADFFLAGARFAATFFRAGARRAADFFRAPPRFAEVFFLAPAFLTDDLRADLRDDFRADLRDDFRAGLRLVVFFAEDFLRVDFFAVFLFPPLRAAIGTLL